MLAGLLGLAVSVYKLRKIGGTVAGLIAGLLFALFWFTMDNSAVAPTTADIVSQVLVIPTMTLIGLYISILLQLLSPRPTPDIPSEEGWQNRILTP